jgi:hypothetical protein
VAAQSIAASEIAENSIGSAGVRMVESVPILDTSDPIYPIFSVFHSLKYLIGLLICIKAGILFTIFCMICILEISQDHLLNFSWENT